MPPPPSMHTVAPRHTHSTLLSLAAGSDSASDDESAGEAEESKKKPMLPPAKFTLQEHRKRRQKGRPQRKRIASSGHDGTDRGAKLYKRSSAKGFSWVPAELDVGARAAVATFDGFG